MLQQLSRQLGIGNTSLISIPTEGTDNRILCKAEYENGSGSIKDRPALNMIIEAINSGKLQQGGTIIEATSGNTGIALAYIGRELGYKVILTMPSTMTVERRDMLSQLGAQLVLVDGIGMQPSIDKAIQLAELIGGVMISQFDNLANKRAHEISTAREILDQTQGNIDVFVAGVGTGGTISGVGNVLKQYNKNIEIIAVEPSESAVLSGATAGAHGIQGIGAGFVPTILDMNVIDRVVTVSTQDAINMWLQLNNNGYCVGISSGANVYVASQLLLGEHKGRNIVTVLPDSNNRYTKMYKQLTNSYQGKNG